MAVLAHHDPGPLADQLAHGLADPVRGVGRGVGGRVNIIVQLDHFVLPDLTALVYNLEYFSHFNGRNSN